MTGGVSWDVVVVVVVVGRRWGDQLAGWHSLNKKTTLSGWYYNSSGARHAGNCRALIMSMFVCC